MYVYKTTNLITGRIYVGQHNGKTKNYLGSGTILKKAFKKYGKKNFKKEILEECSTKEDLCEKEKYWIKYYDAKNPEIGYNIKDGGSYGIDLYINNPNGDSLREKISKGKKKASAKLTQEERDRIYGWRRVNFTEEEKEKIRDLYCEKKMSVRKITKIVGYSYPTLRRAMDEAGIILRRYQPPKPKGPPKVRKIYTEEERKEKYGWRRRHFSDTEKEKARKLYCEDKLTIKELCKVLGLSYPTVAREMKECNIEITRSWPSKTKGKPRTKETKEKVSATHLKNVLKRLQLQNEEELKNLVVSLYVEKEMSIEELKRTLHIGIRRIRSIFSEKHIVPRTKSECAKIMRKQLLTRQKKDLS